MRLPCDLKGLELFIEFLKLISVYRCPKCNSVTFKKDYWEKKDSMFTEERIGNAINAIGCILMGGHGAGGYWSQATRSRYRKKGYNLICLKCNHSHTITTEISLL